MAGNVLQVRAKPREKRRMFAFGDLRTFGVIAAIVIAGMLGFDAYSGWIGIFPTKFETLQNGTTRVIKVPPGGNVQAAIEQANGGDIVELQAGAVYSGQINLPNKPLTDYVTIRSSSAAELPLDKRVGPSQKNLMATIESGMLGRAAVAAANGAHHYRFVGIEFVATGKIYNYGVIILGGREKRPENVPHHIEIDRSYIHPVGKTVSRRGIALNSADTTIKNSYIEGFAFAGEETQGICGWSGTRNISILNNYIEGGAENIMFGGSDPANAELIPSDIEIRGNTLNKPEAWRENVTVKTLFELKNAKRVTFAGNILTNNWKGSAFRITVRNQDGDAPFSVIEGVTISDNIIKGAGEGINILGKDDTYPSQTLKRLTIRNNLFLDLVGDKNGFEGSGYFIQIADGDNVEIANNTVFNTGNIVTFYGSLPRGFSFHDNITGHGNYGIHGPLDLKSETAKTMFRDNVFINLNSVPQGDLAFPAGNTLIATAREAGFVDTTGGDLRLTPGSKFKGKGSDLAVPR